MISSRIPWFTALAVGSVLMASACRRETPDDAVAAPEPVLEAPTAPPPAPTPPRTLDVPSAWMLSPTGRIASSTSAETTNRPPAPSPELQRILSPYASPQTMVSTPTNPPPAESAASAALRAWLESSTNTVSLEYLGKAAILSLGPDSLSEEDIAARPRAPTETTKAIAELMETTRRTAAALAATSTLSLAFSMEDASEADALAKATFVIREAERSLGKGRVDEAMDLYALALTRFPGMSYANKQLGRLKLARGNFPEAITHLRAAIEGESRPGETMNDLGVALLYSRQPAEATEAFLAAISADGNLAEPRFNLGLALQQAGLLDEAEDAFHQYLERYPGEARAFRELALIDYARNQVDAALERLALAITMDPSWYFAHLDAARMLAEKGRPLEALGHLERALDVAPARAVLATYNQPVFRNLRLMPETRAFEARLADLIRRGNR
ncbi:MAG TPA: tetratricopeptide repeat protein [Kiritimatiellia bacterium]|nr:tetratricopeptide repeat protein [Kiritimatiellia bacterium]HMP34758.1 tetratricopeptide repeat protein [Kiritimatiellia bacterium]